MIPTKTERVEVRPQDRGWVADRPHLPGTPVVGRGDTWLEALGDLLIQDPSVQAFVFDKSGKPVPPSFFGPKYSQESR